MAGLGLTNYTIKDPFGNFIDLSYVLARRTTITGVPNIVTNFKSNGTDIGRLFEQNSFTISPSPAGTTISDASYAYLEITTATTVTLTNCTGMQFYYLAVGGGGGSGERSITNGSGGGGGGGMVAGTFSLNSGSITVTVGAGGVAGISGSLDAGVGGDSIITIPGYSSITAGGGGGAGAVGTGTGQASFGRATNGSGGGGGGAGNSGKAGDGLGGAGGNSVNGTGGGGGGGMGGDGSDAIADVSGGAGGLGEIPKNIGFCPGGTLYDTTYYSSGGAGSAKSPFAAPSPNALIGGGAAGGIAGNGNAGNAGIVIFAFALF